MLFKKRVSQCLLLLLFYSIIVVSDTGCSGTNEIPTDETTDNDTAFSETPVVEYKTYEIKSGDVRFRYLQHPRYCFEYPAIFRLIDVNLGPTPFTFDESRVDFTVIYSELPEPKLSIVIQKPDLFEYHDAHGKLEDWYSWERNLTDNISIDKAMVSGVSAEYLKSFIDQEETRLYPAHQASARTVIFDYVDLVWEIRMIWHYHSTEPPEVQEYFNHVLETFKILD